jgi:hypothetical protein
MQDHRLIKAGELEALPVLHQGQADDCHIDEDGVRYWLSRCTVEDGEPCDDKVTIEVYRKDVRNGSWVEECVYDGRTLEVLNG